MFAACISAVAEDIVISGYSQQSERQALEASTASFGGEVLCDAQTSRALSVWNSTCASATGEETRVWILNDLSCNVFDMNKLASRGGALDDEDHMRLTSLPSLLVLDGDQQSMPVNIQDLPALLRQSGGKQSVRQAKIVETHCSDDLVESFSFVPAEILACLLSFYQDELQLRRILGQDWVRCWRDGHNHKTVWQQVAEVISICDDDDINILRANGENNISQAMWANVLDITRPLNYRFM